MAVVDGEGRESTLVPPSTETQNIFTVPRKEKLLVNVSYQVLYSTVPQYQYCTVQYGSTTVLYCSGIVYLYSI